MKTPKDIVSEQAEDGGIWFIAETAAEAYLQQELRRLHESIEGVSQADVVRSMGIKPYIEHAEDFAEERDRLFLLAHEIWGYFDDECHSSLSDYSGGPTQGREAEWDERMRKAFPRLYEMREKLKEFGTVPESVAIKTI